ncbi:CoA transferase [Arthrobacter sp. MYb213]|uniref:CaiB/BaiF CoA transferase family protein n=1 Tax=Arthrobacter sp. MYb213 TaxID=1848595 RepID=UPI000CFB0E61|nr:CoA transferase [Arthrobacter sp. MYb213]PRB68604.1 carnitine dehydratase [Arthrobacter sp. MYb213]
MTQPMQGVKVVDLSRILAGPLCTMTLGDFGAEVLKVESRAGDETRGWLPPVTSDGVSTYYSAVNRNKQAIVVDFKNSDELRELCKIIDDADVLVQNFRPGVLTQFGLDYESVKETNPGLVYCSISGFGDRGGATLPGFDLLVQAVGGLMSITGEPEGTPSKVGVALVDVLAAQNATTGILLALREREQSGLGQKVDISLMTSMLAGLTNQASSTVATGESPPRLGNAHPSIAPYETFATADGVMVIAVGNNRQFSALVAELGVPELAIDKRFVENLERVKHRRELKELIEEITVQDSASRWTNRLMQAGVPAGKVNSVGEALELAATLGLEPLVSIEDSATGRHSTQVASPINLSRSKAEYRLVPPDIGEHQQSFLSTTKL